MKRSLATLLLLVVAMSAGASGAKTRYTCSLTGKTVSKCCCTMKHGQQYCKLAKKTVSECCCKISTAK